MHHQHKMTKIWLKRIKLFMVGVNVSTKDMHSIRLGPQSPPPNEKGDLPSGGMLDLEICGIR